nr:immunoglobulin heavy chain junction region [Macaca mulatta]MOW79214.1 immunoglobulin heavy chain junction region [Macaca mulatta]MOW81475.1 immunoglobulin heavy chain junction region [Macaca mulatta]MOW82889.1 immunoglobulin heavy chain junction region [Macaca mulatta]MOW83580.1 immunoglobulin heavy chain junction region [Macaca mulatta]
CARARGGVIPYFDYW